MITFPSSKKQHDAHFFTTNLENFGFYRKIEHD